MSTTTDRSDPRLTHGIDEKPTKMAEVYLVLSAEELAKGFVRPVRRTYIHVGNGGPKYPTRELTEEERPRYPDYVLYEEYPADGPIVGTYWTQARLDAAKGCGAATTMGLDLAETYARDPFFYGATFCVSCAKHRPVGASGEFVWEDGTKVGT